MSNDEHDCVVLLNRLISRSVTNAPKEFRPDTHGLGELLEIWNSRRTKKIAVEFLGSEDHEDEDERKKLGIGFDSIRLSGLRVEEHSGRKYATLLIEYVDHNSISFPVVNVESFRGRELSGEEQERGATSTHLVVRLPGKQDYDDGSYRCVVEYTPPLTRLHIEKFLSRQLRRHTSVNEWTFPVTVVGKKGQAEDKHYKYHPKVQLLSDFAQKVGSGGKTLTHVVFTKRGEELSAGKSTDVKHQDFVADVEIKVSAKQAPEDPEERQSFFSTVRQYYENLGYDTRVFFRHARGGTVSGELNRAVASAADVILCQREVITLDAPKKSWVASIDTKRAHKMRELLDKDELWQRVEG